MPFTLGMYDYSSRFTDELLGWSNLLGPLVVWDSPSLGVQVKLFQDSSGVGIVYEPDVLWLGSELGSPLWDLLDSDTWPPVSLQLIVDIPPGSKVRYPDFVGSPLWDTLAVPPSVSCPNFHALLLPHKPRLLKFFHWNDPLSLRGVGIFRADASPKAIRK